MKTLLVRAALRLAGWHTARATFWNDVAEWLSTGKAFSEIRKRGEDGECL